MTTKNATTSTKSQNAKAPKPPTPPMGKTTTMHGRSVTRMTEDESKRRCRGADIAACEVFRENRTRGSLATLADAAAAACPDGRQVWIVDTDAGGCIALHVQVGGASAATAARGGDADRLDHETPSAKEAANDANLAERQATKRGAAKKRDGASEKRTKPRSMSLIDAAAKVLADADAPMNAKAMLAEVEARELWARGAGKTPEATLYSGILREVKTKGDAARFQRAEARGLWVARKVA